MSGVGDYRAKDFARMSEWLIECAFADRHHLQQVLLIGQSENNIPTAKPIICP